MAKFLGAVIFRRTSDGWWRVDEFSHDGRYLGSDSARGYPPPFNRPATWPKECLRLADMKMPSFSAKKEPRVGLVRAIDGNAQSRV